MSPIADPSPGEITSPWAALRDRARRRADRAIEALARARQGRKVALISSGDAGVYGMAGPTFEVLFQAGWTPDSDIEVEIVPGASALNTCAALVGAPLTHDFCAISLSDLLTPWPTIARRHIWRVSSVASCGSAPMAVG